MNVRAVFCFFLIISFSIVAEAQKEYEGDDFEVFKEKGNWGLKVDGRQVLKPKYKSYVDWEEANLIVFSDKKGKLVLTRQNANAEQLKFSGNIQIQFNRPDSLLINGQHFDALLEEIECKKEESYLYKGQFRTNKNNFYFNYSYEGDYFYEYGTTSNFLGVKLLNNDSWLIRIKDAWVQNINDTYSYYKSRRDYGVLNFNNDEFVVHEDSIPVNESFSEKKVRIKRLVSTVFDVEKLYLMPNGNFIFKNRKAKWGGGKQNESTLILTPPKDDFFFIGAGANRGYHVNDRIVCVDFETNNSQLVEDTIYKRERVSGIRINVEGESNSIFETVDPHYGFELNLLDFWWEYSINTPYAQESIREYVVWNQNDQRIYFGWSEMDQHIVPAIDPNSGDYAINNNGNFVVAIDSSQLGKSLFSGIYDLQSKRILSSNNSASTLMSKGDNYIIAYPKMVDFYNPETKEGQLKFEKVLAFVDESNEMTGQADYDDFLPQMNLDSTGQFFRYEFPFNYAFKDNKMSRYFVGMPLLLDDWSDFVFPMYYSDLIRINQDSLYVNDTVYDFKTDDVITFYYWERSSHPFLSVISGEDSTFIPVDTSQLSLLNEVTPFMLSSRKEIIVTSDHLIFNISDQDPQPLYLDNYYMMDREIISIENNSFILDRKRPNQLLMQDFNHLDNSGGFYWVYRNVPTNEVYTFEDIDGFEQSVDLHDQIYEVYDKQLNKIDLPEINSYETIQGLCIVENVDGLFALMDKQGKLITQFEFDSIDFDTEKNGFKCLFSGRFKMDEGGWQEFDENGNPIYEEEPYSTFIPLE